MTRNELEKVLQKKYPQLTQHDIEQIINVLFFKQEMAQLFNRKSFDK